MSSGCTPAVEFTTIILRLRDGFFRSNGCLKLDRNSCALSDYNGVTSVSIRAFVLSDSGNKIIRMDGIIAV